MKPFEFNNAIENLVNLIEMKSYEKARSQLFLIEETYEDLYKKAQKQE